MTIQEGALRQPTAGEREVSADSVPDEIETAREQTPELFYLRTKAGVQIAVAPGNHVALHRIEIPTKSENQARRAAPYVIEDDLAEDIRHVHVAVAPQAGDSRRLVGVVDHNKMADWRQEMTHLSQPTSMLVPETALIPANDGEMVVIDRGDCVVAAYGHGKGFAIEPDLLECLVERICTENQITTLKLYSDRRTVLLPLLSSVEISQMPALTDGQYHDLLLSRADEPPLNLLQGPYGTSVSWGVALKRWQPTFYSMLAVGLGFVILTVLESMSLRSQAEQLEREANAIVRSAMPDVSRIVNPRAQIQNRVRSLQGSNGDVFLAVSAVLFEGLSQSATGRLEALQFDVSRMSLTATLSLAEYDEIETLRSAVLAKGYSFEEGSSRSDGARVISEIKVGVP